MISDYYNLCAPIYYVAELTTRAFVDFLMGIHKIHYTVTV